MIKKNLFMYLSHTLFKLKEKNNEWSCYFIDFSFFSIYILTMSITFNRTS